MSSTFFGFNSAKRSLLTSQKALDIISNNIANSQTPGYTRQRLDVVSIANMPAGRYATRRSTELAGAGVAAAGVSQIRDITLDKRYRDLNSAAVDSGTKAAVLQDVEDVLDNIDTDGLSNALDDFLKQLQSLSSTSSDSMEIANTARGAAENITKMLRDYDSGLSEIFEQTKFELGVGVDDVNTMLEGVYSYTKQIMTNIAANNTDYNELLDKRNLLLDQLSQYGDLKVEGHDDGSIKLTFGGVVVMDNGKDYARLIMKEETDPALPYSVKFAFDNGQAANFTGGSLKANADMLNGNGPYVAAGSGQVAEYGIPYYQTMIDQFAYTFAEAFNKANDAYNEDGTINTDKLMFCSRDSGVVDDINASNIQIAEAWMDDPMMIAKIDGELVYTDTPTKVPVKNNFPWKLDPASLPAGWTYDAGTDTYTPPFGEEDVWWKADPTSAVGWVPIDDPDDPTNPNPYFGKDSKGVWRAKASIPAEWVSVPTEYTQVPTLDTTHLLELIDVFSTTQLFGADAPPVGQVSGTLDEYVSFYTSRLGQDIDYLVSDYDAGTAMANAMLDARDSVSAVNSDEEGVNMLSYQKWYNASARMMTTMDEMLDVLINNMGLVGR